MRLFNRYFYSIIRHGEGLLRRESASQAVVKSQLTLRSPFLDNELVALAYQAPPELAASAQPLLRLIGQGNPALGSVGTDRALRRHSLSVITKLANT
jgi:hypothetical protein